MIDLERKFRPDVEGLRAVAVTLVVLCHAGVPGMEGGYIGVDVFFVLSGFLITGLLVRERATTGSTSMSGFYARRARRILPAGTLVLILTVLASYQWLGFLRGDVIAEDGMWTAAFAANLRFASEGTQYLNLVDPPSPLQHYWSLAVEEQFYLVWPLLFLVVASVAPRVSLTAKLGGVLLVLVVASLTWSIVQTDSNPVWAFFSPLTRAWELAIGALLAVCAVQLRSIHAFAAPWLSWIGIAAIAASVVIFDNTTPFPGFAVALPVLGTAMVVAGGSIAPGRGAEHVLRLPPFQWLGKFSYSFYLWHWPVLIIAAEYKGEILPLTENLMLAALSLGLAIVTYYAVENPVRYARPLMRHPATSLAVGACLAVGAFGLCAWQLRGAVETQAPVLARAEIAEPPTVSMVDAGPAATPTPEVDLEEQHRELVAASHTIEALSNDVMPDLRQAEWDFAWLAPWAIGCLVDAEILSSPPCVFGDPEGSKTIVLLGDSHAAQWLGAFDDMGRRLNWKVVVLTKAGCPSANLTFNVSKQRMPGPPPVCGPWLADSIARINQMNPEVVVLSSCNGCEYMVDDDGNPLSRETWAAGLAETLGAITSPDTTRIVLGDNPRWRGILDCLAKNPNNVQGCSQPTALVTENTYNAVERDAAMAAGAEFIDVVPWFCASVCSPVIGNMVVYTNDHHVTSTYATYLSRLLEGIVTPYMNTPGP